MNLMNHSAFCPRNIHNLSKYYFVLTNYNWYIRSIKYLSDIICNSIATLVICVHNLGKHLTFTHLEAVPSKLQHNYINITFREAFQYSTLGSKYFFSPGNAN